MGTVDDSNEKGNQIYQWSKLIYLDKKEKNSDLKIAL